MNAYCPECETELDITTGICPACRWDPLVARTVTAAKEAEPELSLTERYRSSTIDVYQQQAALDDAARAGVSRGRAFVVVSLIAGVVLYGGVVSAIGIF